MRFLWFAPNFETCYCTFTWLLWGSSTVVFCNDRYEALVFLVMYMLYIFLMFYNRRIESWIVPRVSNFFRRNRTGEELKRTKFAAAELLASMGNNNDIADSEELDNASKFIILEFLLHRLSNICEIIIIVNS